MQHVRAALRPNLPAAAGLRQVDGVNPLFPARVLRARATLEQGDRSARAALLNRLGAAYLISQDATIEPGSPAFAAGPFIHHRAGAILPVRFAGAGEGEIEGVSSAPGRWNFRTTVRQPVSVVIAESWLAGWQASVDGRPARGTRPDDDGLITVALEPGRHAVELVYVSSAARIGLLISLLALAVALGAAWPVSRFGGR